jgi:hypothetical protein
MDVRIGIAESPQIIEIEVENDVDRATLKSDIESAMGGETKVLWLTDRKGKDYAVPADRIAFVELGTADVDRRIGFAP